MSEPPYEVRIAQLQEIQDRLDRDEINSDGAFWARLRLYAEWYRMNTGQEWPA